MDIGPTVPNMFLQRLVITCHVIQDCLTLAEKYRGWHECMPFIHEPCDTTIYQCPPPPPKREKTHQPDNGNTNDAHGMICFMLN